MKVTAKLPDVLEMMWLLDMEVLDMETLQLLQFVLPHDAKEVPVAMNDHTYGPTITLIAPPYTCKRRLTHGDKR
jgi:hypothetical protein